MICGDELIEGSAIGAGPVDAIYVTIDHLIEEKIDLVDFIVPPKARN